LPPLDRQCGVSDEAARQAASGSDVDKHDTQLMATQMGVVPLQAQPAMSVLPPPPPPRSPPPPTIMRWHSRAARSQANPLGHGRASSQ
jgi:hypothetical protein